MRAALSEFLSQKAANHSNFFVLSGDHGYALFDELRRKKPGQFINAGVSEQAMVGYAAGMAKEGLKVAVYGLAAFIPIRVLEFIKMDICYERLPVIFLGDGAGLVYSTLGASHQCAEDIACLRTLPDMHIFSPADRFEMKACLEAAYSTNAPCYIRIGKADKGVVHKAELDLPADNLIPVRLTDQDSCIVATGSMVSTALDLNKQHLFDIFSAPRLFPLNSKKVRDTLRAYKTIITLEEHSVKGGLGSTITEALTEENSAEVRKFIRIGIDGRFTARCGSYEYALHEHGLSLPLITSRLKAENVIP